MLDLADDMLKDGNADEDRVLEVLSMVYHSLLYIQPFWDGNEKVARLFTNYLALGYQMPMFDIAPDKENKPKYMEFISAVRNADSGDISTLISHLNGVISKLPPANKSLGPSARRIDE